MGPVDWRRVCVCGGGHWGLVGRSRRSQRGFPLRLCPFARHLTPRVLAEHVLLALQEAPCLLVELRVGEGGFAAVNAGHAASRMANSQAGDVWRCCKPLGGRHGASHCMPAGRRLHFGQRAGVVGGSMPCARSPRVAPPRRRRRGLASRTAEALAPAPCGLFSCSTHEHLKYGVLPLLHILHQPIFTAPDRCDAKSRHCSALWRVYLLGIGCDM